MCGHFLTYPVYASVFECPSLNVWLPKSEKEKTAQAFNRPKTVTSDRFCQFSCGLGGGQPPAAPASPVSWNPPAVSSDAICLSRNLFISPELSVALSTSLYRLSFHEVSSDVPSFILGFSNWSHLSYSPSQSS